MKPITGSWGKARERDKTRAKDQRWKEGMGLDWRQGKESKLELMRQWNNGLICRVGNLRCWGLEYDHLISLSLMLFLLDKQNKVWTADAFEESMSKVFKKCMTLAEFWSWYTLCVEVFLGKQNTVTDGCLNGLIFQQYRFHYVSNFSVYLQATRTNLAFNVKMSSSHLCPEISFMLGNDKNAAYNKKDLLYATGHFLPLPFLWYYYEE